MLKTIVLFTSGNVLEFKDLQIRRVIKVIEDARKAGSNIAHFEVDNLAKDETDDVYIFIDHVEAIHTEEYE